MNEVVPIRPSPTRPDTEEQSPLRLSRTLAAILESEPEVAAWLAADDDDEPPAAA